VEKTIGDGLTNKKRVRPSSFIQGRRGKTAGGRERRKMTESSNLDVVESKWCLQTGKKKEIGRRDSMGGPFGDMGLQEKRMINKQEWGGHG